MKRILLLALLFAPVCSFAQTATYLGDGTDSTQLLTFFSATSGTGLSSDSTVSHTGPRSIRITTGNPATSSSATTLGGALLDTGSQISFWFRYDVLPAAPANILVLRQSGLSAVSQIQINASGQLVNAPVGATSATGTQVLAVNTWYRISLSYYITNTTTFQFRIYINGNLDSTANAGTLTRTSTDRFTLTGQDAAGTDRVFWFDDVYAATGGASSGSQPDTGNVLVTAKRPISNGTAVQLDTEIGSGPAPNGVGTGHAPNVSERPLSQSFGWSKLVAGVALTEEYNVQGVSAGDVDITGATIKGVMGWIWAGASSSHTGAILLQNATTAISLTSTPGVFTKIGTNTYPLGTGTDIGIVTGTAAETVSIYEAGILIGFDSGGGRNLPVMGVGE